ncbi:Cadherin Egf Lag Seven-Pass G-Type Receptor 2 [Manis pentadactyla]|nr:Cadherin Egf Lag Seven-Pass G-Type Receptor 2 [Manis pentadactyla]
MDFLNFKEKLKILMAKEDKEYFKIVISRLIPFKKEKVFSHIAADIQMLINPVNLPENTLPGTQLSRAYDKDVAGKANVYHFLNKTKDFIIDATTLEIDEDYPLFQSLYRMTATDEDSSNGDTLVVFQLALRATDKTGLFCQGTLIIKIRNINDEKPQFEPFPLNSINVTENKPVGEIVARVKATDRDEDSNISYSFKTQQKKFGLDPFTGIITILQPLNLDNPNNPKIYSLEIEARDNGNNTSTYMFTVFVENIDDPIVCDSSFSTGAVKATAYFALDLYNGIISKTTEPLLDYETNPKQFQIVVAVRNRENLSLESCVGTITINIKNVNDEGPVLTYIPDAPINIYENLPVGTKLVKLTATDRDTGDSVHYEFIDSGEVMIAYPLDYEDAATPHSWILHFRVYDNGREHSTTGTLTVILQDVNDNPPHCPQDIYTIELPENIPLETLVVCLTCTDKDGTVPNNNITYHLIKDTFSNETFTLTNNELRVGPTHLDYDNAVFAGMHFKYTLFVKVSDEGSPVLSRMIKLLESLDRETESQYKIAVRITDFDNDAVPDPLRQRSGTAQVTVNVLNMNDEPPVCNPPHLETQINSTIKIPFIQLNCSDKDSPQEELSYSIVGVTVMQYLFNSQTGEVKILNN